MVRKNMSVLERMYLFFQFIFNFSNKTPISTVIIKHQYKHLHKAWLVMGLCIRKINPVLINWVII